MKKVVRMLAIEIITVTLLTFTSCAKRREQRLQDIRERLVGTYENEDGTVRIILNADGTIIGQGSIPGDLAKGLPENFEGTYSYVELTTKSKTTLKTIDITYYKRTYYSRGEEVEHHAGLFVEQTQSGELYLQAKSFGPYFGLYLDLVVDDSYYLKA